MQKVLIVDDSALMRRKICDIINTDKDFQVSEMSMNTQDAYNKIAVSYTHLFCQDIGISGCRCMVSKHTKTAGAWRDPEGLAESLKRGDFHPRPAFYF